MRTNEQNTALKRNATIAGLTLLGLFSFVLATNPRDMPVLPLLIMPAFVFVSLLYTARTFIILLTNIEERALKLVSVLIAAGPTLLVLLGSLGQVNIQDVLLTALLAGGFVMYFRRLYADPA